jgi:D-arabinose 1-dehydrogenase-like Zn-dependent alcohol dehydrogenase
MGKMIAVQVSRGGGPFEVVERPLPEPGAGQVRLRVEACGVCHSDMLVKEGHWPGLPYPRVPGHEVVGTVEAVGPGVRGWVVGDRAGVGWHGGQCYGCHPCRKGDFAMCATSRVTGITHDGGYASHMIAPAESMARLPKDIPAAEAGPLLCAGLTVFNALRHTAARAGDVVAIQGIGGLGHLGVQFAAKMGFKTVAVSRGADKRAFAAELGAHAYIDTNDGDLGAQLQALGGAKVALATAPSGAAIASLVPGLGIDGQLVIAAAPHDSITISALPLIMGRRSIKGWYSGVATDSEDTVAFAVQAGVKPMVETFKLEQAEEAYQRMITNQARFRVVLTMDHLHGA